MRGDSGVALPAMEEEESARGLKSDSIPTSMFSDPGAAGFKVRGPNYLQDKKKVQVLTPHLVYPPLLTMPSYFAGAEFSTHCMGTPSREQ